MFTWTFIVFAPARRKTKGCTHDSICLFQTGWTIAVDVVIGPNDGISYRAEQGSIVSLGKMWIVLIAVKDWIWGARMCHHNLCLEWGTGLERTFSCLWMFHFAFLLMQITHMADFSQITSISVMRMPLVATGVQTDKQKATVSLKVAGASEVLDHETFLYYTW